jgi:DNA-binding NtrC family response regulator
MKKQFCILVVDDDQQQREMLTSYLSNHSFNTVTAENGKQAIEALTRTQVDLIVSDVRMPEMNGFTFHETIRKKGHEQPILFITAFPDVRDAVAAMRDGAVNYLEKPVDLNEMLDSIHHSLKIEISPLEYDTEIPDLPDDIVIKSKQMLDLLKDTSLVAPSDVSVLICGESGTGKEVIADIIHQWSKRSQSPFLKINCAAIPENLLESELFGYEKGAFTGASSKKSGFFEQADGGTILLDEISEMPLSLQAKLLRVTQDGSFIPLGSNQQKKFNVRIIAATNKDLENEVTEKRFREDLFYRLNTFELFISPLRERKEDIRPMAIHFASAGAKHKRLTEKVVNIFNAYTWPGNVRELQNTVKRAILMAAGGDTISIEHLPRKLQETTAPDIDTESEEGVIDQMERMIILQTLEKNNFNRSQTARDLKMSRRTLTFKIRRLKEAGYEI